MFSLTPHERKALLFLTALLLLGASLRIINRGADRRGLFLSPSAGSESPVNINSAGLKELEGLPLIGPKTAQEIIRYREQHGDFGSIEDLMKVKGIGEKKSTLLKEHIFFK